MKKYMKRTIIECVRQWDPYGSPRVHRSKDIEDLPAKEPMRRYHEKDFNDRLRPLLGYLSANCGRPWNDVWSEICAVNDSRNVAGWHLRTHVLQYVDTNHRHVHERWYADWFFVDDEGILWETGRKGFTDAGIQMEQERRRKLHAKPIGHVEKDGRIYKKSGGFWFEEITEKKERWDPLYNKMIVWTDVTKRQLNRKELRDLGIKNNNQK